MAAPISRSWITSEYELDPMHNCAGGVDEDYFEFPHMALSSNYLYVTANVSRKPTRHLPCTTMMRFSLDEVATTVNVEYYSSDDTLANFTPAHGGTDTFYFATHEDADTLQVYTWPESVGPGSVVVTSIDHDAYLVPSEPGIRRLRLHALRNADESMRLTTMTVCRTGSVRRDTDRLTFMWDAPQGVDGQGTFDWPRIRYVMLDVSSGTPATTPLEDDSIYNADFAWFLPAAAVNARGHVGGVAAFAGGASTPIYPGCAAWIYDDYSTSFLPLEAMEVTTAAGNPDGDGWGDYYGARMSGLNPFQWIGSCYAVEMSGINSHVVRFGREARHLPAAEVGL